ncbi:MAG: single-stranded DNA-binding protein [Acidimicrobiales bacterium]
MNTVTLIGRLTSDPELRTTNGGTPVCTLRLAVNRPPKDGKDQGAVFVDVVSFNRQAEAVAEHLGKGRQVAVTGRLEYRQWEGNDGSPHSNHEVVANQVEFLAKPATNGASQPEPYASGEEPF